MKSLPVRVLILLAVLLTMLGLGAQRLLSVAEAADRAATHPAFANPPSELATPPPGAVPGAIMKDIMAQAEQDNAILLLLAWIVVAALLLVVAPKQLRQLRTALFSLAGYFITLPLSGIFMAGENLEVYGQVRFVAELLRLIVIASLAAAVALHVVSRVFRSALPVILTDILLAGAYIAIGLTMLSRAGFNISGIIATSAVLTAVIGFSLQDTLSNVMSGVVLEMENVVNVGDWVRIGDVEGRVKERRWRQTTIETRNWDVAVVPNSILMKNQVMVLGRRDGHPTAQRRWIWFHVDLSASPTQVIELATRAVVDAPIENVAPEPKANTVCMDFKDGVGVYALRYWMIDMAPNDPTDSRVRERIYMGLQRAGLRIAAPNHAVTMVEKTAEYRETKERAAVARKLAALRKLDIFKALEDGEQEQVAMQLRYTPFAAGECITRQGDVSDCLYLVVQGNTRVTVSSEGIEKQVAELGPGSLFGEMGVLTGERRSANVHAASAVECWRLDRESLEEIIRKRPKIADELSAILARRKGNLQEIRDALQRDNENKRLRAEQDDIRAKISRFLGLNA